MYNLCKYNKGKLTIRTHNIPSIQDADGIVGWIRQSRRADSSDLLFLVEKDYTIVKIYGEVLWEK